MALPPNCLICFSRVITRVIAREKQRRQSGGGAIADTKTRAKKRELKRPLKSCFKGLRAVFRNFCDFAFFGIFLLILGIFCTYYGSKQS
jgi:hypothetical protein